MASLKGLQIQPERSELLMKKKTDTSFGSVK